MQSIKQRTKLTKHLPVFALLAVTCTGFLLSPESSDAADEFSSGDKLRTLYSNHFAFTDNGLPQVTIEIMGGVPKAQLQSTTKLVVMPDGEGGSKFTGGNAWSVHVENGRPAKVREWVVVARFPAADSLDSEVELARWKKKGHTVQAFETGTIFAVQGQMLDTRTILVGIDPVARGLGLAKSRTLSKRFGIEATVHTELLRRPTGTIVAKNGNMEIRNPSVMWFASDKSTGTIEVVDVPTGGGGSQLHTQKHNRNYWGAIYATVGSDGKLTVVNAVATDDLLSGLVPSEIFPDAPMEALRTQSIAARTELLHKLGVRHLGDPFLLCASQHCQVYSGAGQEHPRTNKAVRSTRGLVLVDPHSALVDARYSATCGGHSEHNEVVWGGPADAVLRGHLDGPSRPAFADGITDNNVEAFLDSETGAYCAGTQYSKNRFRWRVSTTAEALSKRVAASYPQVGRVLAIQPISRGVSGRIAELQITGSKGKTLVRGELVIRRLFGGLRSSLFIVKPTGPETRPTTFEFRGAGFGHGVGMCQLGAIGMASKGMKSERILQHYYTGATLHRLY